MPLGLKAVLEPLIKIKRIGEFQHLLLIGRSLGVLKLTGLAALRPDFMDHRAEFDQTNSSADRISQCLSRQA